MVSAAQIERLGLLAEECAEVIAVVGKILRHGLDSYNPEDEEETLNGRLLGRELGDVEYAIALLIENNEIFPDDIREGREISNQKKPKYLHHQGKR